MTSIKAGRVSPVRYRARIDFTPCANQHGQMEERIAKLETDSARQAAMVAALRHDHETLRAEMNDRFQQIREDAQKSEAIVHAGQARLEHRMEEGFQLARQELTATETRLRDEIAASEARLISKIDGRDSVLRSEIKDSEAKLRSEIHETESKLRSEISNSEAKLRSEISNSEAKLRTEISNSEAK